MRAIGTVAIILLAIVLCIATIKGICWLSGFDKETDKKMIGIELEDYENDKICVIAVVIVFFIFATIGVVYLFLTR